MTRSESPWIVTRPGGRELRYMRMCRTPAYSATLLDIALPLPATRWSLTRMVPSAPLISTPRLAVPPGLTGSRAPSNQARNSFMLLSRLGGGRGGGREKGWRWGENSARHTALLFANVRTQQAWGGDDGKLIFHGAAGLAAVGGLAFAVSEFDRGHPSNGFARLGLAQPPELSYSIATQATNLLLRQDFHLQDTEWFIRPLKTECPGQRLRSLAR